MPGTSVAAMMPWRRAIRLANADRAHVVGAEEDRKDDADCGDDERSQQRPAQAVDREHPVAERVREQQDACVREQDE